MVGCLVSSPRVNNVATVRSTTGPALAASWLRYVAYATLRPKHSIRRCTSHGCVALSGASTVVTCLAAAMAWSVAAVHGPKDRELALCAAPYFW